MKKTWVFGLVVLALCIGLAASSIVSARWGFWNNHGDNNVSPEQPTFTPLPTMTPYADEDSLPTETAIVFVPTVTSPPPLGPSTNATGASCLPGIWQINHQSVINYINLSMLGVKEYGFHPESSEGKLELQISPGQINLLADDLTVAVGVNVGEMADISAFSALIESYATANYLASDHQIALTGIRYDANGTITSLSSSFTVNFDDLFSLAQTLGFARGLPNPITSRTMSYTCSGDVLTIVVNSYSSVAFDRVIN